MSATLQRKVQKVLSSGVKFDSPDMVQATEGLSELFSSLDNTLDNRRKLRSLLDHRSVDVHQSLVNSFHSVDAQLSSLSSSISSLVTICESSLAQLTRIQTNNTLLVEKTSALTNKQSQLQHQYELANTFVNSLTLSSASTAIIETGDINEEYFTIISQVINIREQCKQIVSQYQHRLGLDVFDQLTKQLDTAYERLYRYVQQETTALSSASSPTPSASSPTSSSSASSGSILSLSSLSSASVYIRALALLQSQPVYYDHCLSEIAQSHRLYVINQFLRALTRGNGSTVRPIELHAHDAVRYITDMFLWIQASVASETEFISQLFSMIATASIDFKVPRNEEKAAADAVTMLAAIYEGVARLLKQRVEQALTTQPIPETAFKEWNVIQYYANTISALFTEKATIRATMKGLTETARANFFDIIKKQGEKLTQAPPSHTHDLSPPHIVNEAISQLNTIMQMHAASLSSTAAPPTPSALSASTNATAHILPTADFDFNPVLTSMVDPLLASIQLGSENLSPADQSIYLINVLQPLLTLLKKYEFARVRLEILTLTLDSEMEKLIQLHYETVMKKSGLLEKLQIIEKYQQEEHKTKKLVELPGMEPAALNHAINSFYASASTSTSSAESDPQLADSSLLDVFSVHSDRILNSALRRFCRQSVATAISAAYRKLYEAVKDSNSGYTDTSHILTHSPQQVELLLEVEKGAKRGTTVTTPATFHRDQTAAMTNTQ